MQSDAILEKLLTIEMERLETAVRIEKERKIVFPETSIIIRDILKLNHVLNQKNENNCEIDFELDKSVMEIA